MVTINIKKSREFRDTKRNIQLILISSLLFFSVIIGYFNGFNRFNDIRRILTDINNDDYPHEDSGSFQGNIIEDEHLYPPNLFTDEQIAQWAWILHFIGMFYMFIGISIVCDDYFVPTLETIVEKLDMSDDTAGATWLAAGGSAPELFTSFIGIFIAKSDVGFGTIVGSAVFNVLFVVGMCAFFTPGNLPLNWWPFARDLAYYIFSLGILSIFFGGTSPGEIEWWESLTLFLLYIIYVVIMGYNQDIKTWFFSKFINTDNKPSILLKEYKSKEELVQENITGYSSFISSNNDKNNKNIAVTVETENDNDINNDLKSDNNSDFEYEYCDGPDITYPVYGTYFDKFMFIIKYPIMISTYMTLADVTRESQKKYWPWTFIVSLIWLGAFAYFMVWWAVIVGHCWNIPDEIMGLTFLAAGTSIPELFSCILVAKKGKADMAISGSIGSNIFDVLVGLSLPWFFYSIIMGNGTVKVEADRLFLSLILLVIILIALTIAIHCNKWVLTHSLGFIMFLLWIFFVTQDLLRHFLDLDQKWFGSSLVTK